MVSLHQHACHLAFPEKTVRAGEGNARSDLPISGDRRAIGRARTHKKSLSMNAAKPQALSINIPPMKDAVPENASLWVAALYCRLENLIPGIR